MTGDTNTRVDCLICGAAVQRVDRDSPTQPYGGTSFYSHGNYGSTVFDPFDGQYLHVIICDPCLTSRMEQVLMGRDSRPVFVEGVVLGSERVRREEVPWDPKVSHSFDKQDTVQMDAEDALAYADDERITWNIDPRKYLATMKAEEDDA